jgi:hypothetical protein
MRPQAMQERLLELECDRALEGLTPERHAELRALRGPEPERWAIGLELAATSVDLASMGAVEQMPAALAARVWAAASPALGVVAAARESSRQRAFVPLHGGTVPMPQAVPLHAVPSQPAPAPVARGGWVRWAGWMAAAACLLFALASWLPWFDRSAPVAKTPEVPTVSAPPPAPEPPKPPGPAEARAALLADGKDVVKADWSAAKDPTSKGVTGDVVWSPSAQRGYMTFHGLAVNDREKLQYQLWIFDKEQDARFPIDGGVFDIDQESGDVVVPIAAKIGVVKPTLFAITIEKPGGVVVSKRDRVVVTASVSG